MVLISGATQLAARLRLLGKNRLMIWWSLLQLKSKSPRLRRRAVERLGAEGGARAWDALVGALQDADGDVRKTAAEALGKYKKAQNTDPLIAAFRDPDAGVRGAAAESLRRVGSLQALGPLVGALEDPSGAVRWHAAKVLEELEWEPANNAQRALLAVARGDLEKATSYGPDAVEPLTLALRTGAYHERHAAVNALGKIADARVLKPLLVALKDKDYQVRCAAVEALRKLVDQAAVGPLIAALKDVHHHVRAAAAEALGQFGNPQAIEPIIPLLRDKNWEVRQVATLALGKFRDPRIFDPVAALLKDPDREVREAAVRTLEQMGDRRVIGPLVLALKDEQDVVRQMARVALRNLDPHWERTEAARAAASQLRAGLTNAEYWVRQSAADALARISELQAAEARAVTPVEPALIAPSHYLRQAAMDTLVSLLRDFDHELRVAAAEALGRIGHPGAAEALTHSLSDSDAGVQAAAANALEILRGKPGPETNPPVQGGVTPV